jgi:PEP-CTERM motif
MKRLLTLAMTVCAVALVVTPAGATSLSFEFNVDHCTGTCGGGPYGTIDVSQFAPGDVLLDMTLDPDVLGFVGTGFPGTLGFNLVDPDPTITVTFDSPASGWNLLNTIAGSYQFNGFGDFEYVLVCDVCQGGSNPQDVELKFHVLAAGLTPESFLELSTGNTKSYFVADLMGSNRNTGPIGTSLCDEGCGGSGGQQAAVPEPGSLLLLGSGLAFAGRTVRRRRRK